MRKKIKLFIVLSLICFSIHLIAQTSNPKPFYLLDIFNSQGVYFSDNVITKTFRGDTIEVMFIDTIGNISFTLHHRNKETNSYEVVKGCYLSNKRTRDTSVQVRLYGTRTPGLLKVRKFKYYKPNRVNTWYYYNNNQQLQKKEVYIDGKLVSVMK